MAFNATTFYDFLFDQSPHFDKDILKDWFPTDDAWMGHISTMPWESFTGTQHVFDHVHVGAPDLSQAWTAFDTQGSLQVLDNTNAGAVGQDQYSGANTNQTAPTNGCVANACTPAGVLVGWGSTRKTYGRARQRYQTNVLCFDQMNTRAKAKEQLSQIIKGIKELTKNIWSDYMRSNALMQSNSLYIAGANQYVLGAASNIGQAMPTISGNLNTITLPGASNTYLPTSNLSIQYLQRFYEPLQANGYFKSKYVPNGMFKLITDPLTSQQLIEQNPSLIHGFKFETFQKGGELFKYGMSKAIGNFGISWDSFPARFYYTGSGVLKRVWPWINAAATIGVKPIVNPAWINAPIQLSYVWHPEALKRAVPSLTSVHPEMPFLTRDLGGKWHFTGPESDVILVNNPADNTNVAVDNKARNQGLWWADFEAGFRPEFMDEWTRAILHLREPGCIVDNVPCTVPAKYISGGQYVTSGVPAFYPNYPDASHTGTAPVTTGTTTFQQGHTDTLAACNLLG